MKKNLLNEIKAMNKIAGTQLTKEQEIDILKQALKEAMDKKGDEYPEYDDVKAAVKKFIQHDNVERILKNLMADYLYREKGMKGARNSQTERLYDKVISDMLKF